GRRVPAPCPPRRTAGRRRRAGGGARGGGGGTRRDRRRRRRRRPAATGAGTPRGAAGHGARRTLRPGDRRPAQTARRHGQDPRPPGPDRDAGGAGMSGEHASRRLIDDYARGDATMAADTVWALEAHLETCAPCRSHLAASVATEVPDVAALLDTV